MWVFLSDAMLSVVEDRNDPDLMLVRARLEGDIERVFPTALVRKTPNADYLFRASIARTKVVEAMVAAIRSIDYDNFKNSVPPGDAARKYHYSGVWAEMADAQISSADNKGDLPGWLRPT